MSLLRNGKLLQNQMFCKFLKYQPLKFSKRNTTHDYCRRMSGNREYVGFGVNGAPIYVDLVDFPMPAIRFREPTPEICLLRKKEEGNWKDLTMEEIKQLYRYSFCRTFSEMKAPTGEWKLHIGVALWACTIGILLTIAINLYHQDLPETFAEERRQAQLKRMIALEVNPINGLSSKWDYEKRDWNGMCEYSCVRTEINPKHRKLTLLLLDCWQREYDKRPYRHFKFERLMFEERLARDYDPKEDFSVIVSFLTKRSLCSIKLVGLTISNDDTSLLDGFVRSLQKLQRIELKLMDLPIEFFQLLAFKSQQMKIKELSLEGTCLNDEAIDQLHSFITKSLDLSKLNVSGCNINQYNFAQLADAIHKSLKVQNLNISYILGCHLTLDSGKIAHTVSSLIWQNQLQELTMENCGFIAHDMSIISEYLYDSCCKLQLLNVSYNNLAAQGALELFKAISCSGTLKDFKLNGCNLSTHGGEMVAQYLCSCWNLRSLELQRNNIGPEAVNMILLCWKKPCALKKLSLFGNSFNKRTGYILKRLLDAGVLVQADVDITVTFDDTLEGYRVIPWLA